MSEEEEAGRTQDGEVLGPEIGSSDASLGDSYIALISQYTERPDLLIEALEKNDPGFVKRMNEKAEVRSERMAGARFWFGGFQAYSGLFVSVCAAITVLCLLAYSVIYSSADFWLVISLAVFYAVSQGGPSGFIELCRGLASFFSKDSSKPE